MVARLAALFAMTASVWAADFYTGQAARAVLGQSSFSSNDSGVQASALFLSEGRLYALDTQHRLLAYDLTKVRDAVEGASARDQSRCAYCGVQPVATLNQVLYSPMVPIAQSGDTVAEVDRANKHVLIWRDVGKATAGHAADLVLRGTLVDPVSVALSGTRLFVGDAALHQVFIWNSIPVSADQAPDAILGQPPSDTKPIPSADNFGTPAALAADASELFVADPQLGRILVFSQADYPLRAASIVNSASLSVGPVAAGSLITIFGERLSDSTEAAPDDGVQHLPSKLGGVEVVFDGVALPMLSAAPTQLRAQIPYGLAATSGSLYVRTEHGDGSVTMTNAAALRIVPASPGLFAFPGPEPRDGMVLHADGSPVTSESPAIAGELITVWAAGLGGINNADANPLMGVPYPESSGHVSIHVAALVNGRSAQVLSADLPEGSIGIYEVRVFLPSATRDSTHAQLLIMQDGAVSNTLTFPLGSLTR